MNNPWLKMDHPWFSEEALEAQDGRIVPLTAYPGGPVVGEATLKYDTETQSLNAEMRIDDPNLAEVMGNTMSTVIFRQGEVDGR